MTDSENATAPVPPTLTAQEKLVLAGLLRVAIRLDGRVTPEERSTLDAIADELYAAPSEQHFPGNPYRSALSDPETPGPDAPAQSLAALMQRAAEQFPDDETLRAAASGVTRQEAREILFGAVYSVVVADTISTAEGSLLKWLETEWKIPPADPVG